MYIRKRWYYLIFSTLKGWRRGGRKIQLRAAAATAKETTNKDRGKRTGRRGGQGPFPPRNTAARKGRWWGLSLRAKAGWDRKREMAEGVASTASNLSAMPKTRRTGSRQRKRRREQKKSHFGEKRLEILLSLSLMTSSRAEGEKETGRLISSRAFHERDEERKTRECTTAACPRVQS